MTSIRVIEGGGKGFRSTDVTGGKTGDIKISREEISGLNDLVAFALSDLPENNIAIAFSLAGDIADNCKVVISPNQPWLNGVNLSEACKSVRKPVFVFNDMETAVEGMAEIFPSLDFFVGMTWSSGIGMRIFKNGEIIAPKCEAGHIRIDYSSHAPLCGCGGWGCIESIAGGLAVTRRIVAEAQIMKINIPSGKHPCAFLDEAFMDKKKWAIYLYWVITSSMGKYLAILQNVLGLPAIVWKGGFAQKALRLPGIEEAIRSSMRLYLMNPDWESDLSFHFVPTTPEVIEDFESFVGAATLTKKRIS